MFAPTYGKAAERHQDITFAKVDTEAEQALAAAASITSIPTLMAFNATGLEEVVQAVKNMDMGKLRADEAQQPASSTHGLPAHILLRSIPPRGI